ncbi:predicted protein [Naegleria gruberi]|uniref:Predicted protein n=1 Tax=Naegleria gruberi TaxID=5762 RepID=D2W3V5_NAEGR|nr:uncharacterized protein NAEGRDRAFT_76079 [Naegleria gruberi]EFC36261.1 predicted protein [Naegleria gruberi]|eukprot:XP_002669005.1 predicted protein [Naegleria gruberi strain NEG-M]
MSPQRSTHKIHLNLFTVMIVLCLNVVVLVLGDKFIFNHYGDMDGFSGKIIQLTFPYINNTTNTYYLSRTEKRAYTDCNEFRIGSYKILRNSFCGNCKVLDDSWVGDHATVSTLVPSMYPLCYIEKDGNQTNYRVVAINFQSQLQATTASATPYCHEECGAECCNSNSVVASISLK